VLSKAPIATLESHDLILNRELTNTLQVSLSI
jgi:hypothetical protein